MQKWKYIRVALAYSTLDNTYHDYGYILYLTVNGKAILDKNSKTLDAYDYLNKLGEKGWELVSTQYEDKLELYYFKLPVE